MRGMVDWDHLSKLIAAWSLSIQAETPMKGCVTDTRHAWTTSTTTKGGREMTGSAIHDAF